MQALRVAALYCLEVHFPSQAKCGALEYKRLAGHSDQDEARSSRHTEMCLVAPSTCMLATAYTLAAAAAAITAVLRLK